MRTERVKMDLRMDLRERGYDIQIGEGLLESFDFRRFRASKFVILVDSHTRKLFAEQLAVNLSRYNLPFEVIEFSPGENSKSLESVGEISSELARRKVDKNAVILALGGGVVGDLSGFVASVYERGIRYIHIPTTLLAQVDSSIGGKTGVNIPEGKNLLGSIHRPLAVLIDIKTLETLPDEEIRYGLSEVVKYGVMNDRRLFRHLEEHIDERDPKFFRRIIRQSAQVKTSVVRKDEREHEFRKILNYGHTVGHAIENLSGHTIPHGEAVAYGMVYEGAIAERLGYFSQSELKRQNDLIKRLGFSHRLDFNPDELIEVMRRDKKSVGGELYFVLPDAIGRVHIQGGKVAVPVDPSIVLECLGEIDAALGV